MSKFKVEVQADSSGKWATNAMVYLNFDDAAKAAKDLAARWMLVTAARVAEYPEGIDDAVINRAEVEPVNATVVF